MRSAFVRRPRSADPTGRPTRRWRGALTGNIHDVYLAVVRPAPGRPQRPPRRPQSGAGVDAPAHLEISVLPRVKAAGHQARGRVLGKLTGAAPVRRVRLVRGVRVSLAARFDHQQTVFNARVLRLIPLQLLVSDEAALERPVVRVRRAAVVELVGPGQGVAGRRRRWNGWRRRLYAHQRRERDACRRQLSFHAARGVGSRQALTTRSSA